MSDDENEELSSVDKELFTSIRLGSINKVEHYIKLANVNAINKKGETLLTYALQRDEVKLEIIKCLIENGADIDLTNKLGNNAIASFILTKWDYFLTRDESFEIIKYLLESGADFNSMIYTALEFQFHHIHTREFLYKETLLMYVAFEGSLKLVKLLIEYGADPNIVCNGIPKTVLDIVNERAEEDKRTKKFVEIRDYLISKGAIEGKSI